MSVRSVLFTAALFAALASTAAVPGATAEERVSQAGCSSRFGRAAHSFASSDPRIRAVQEKLDRLRQNLQHAKLDPRLKEKAAAVLADCRAEIAGLDAASAEARTRFVDAALGGRALPDPWANVAARAGAVRELGSRERPIAFREVGAERSKVWQVSENGRAKYFRPLGADREANVAARRGWVAARLAADLGQDVAPPSELARVNGVLGVLSDEVPGIPLERYGSRALGGIRRVLTGNWRPLSPDAHARLEAFELFIGEADGHGRNFHVDRAGSIRGLDFDDAFAPHLPIVRNPGGDPRDFQHPIQWGLPARYDRAFLRHLRELTPARLHERYADSLDEAEIGGLIFRREIILRDAAERGEAALFPA